MRGKYHVVLMTSGDFTIKSKAAYESERLTDCVVLPVEKATVAYWACRNACKVSLTR